MAADAPVRDDAWAFAGENAADLGAAITRLLRSLPARPRLLGLGEAMHGEETLPRLRNEVFRHLVEHEGYRSIALESDCLAGLTVDAYVTEGVGELDDVVRRGLSHGSGELESSRELVRWMREHNQDRPASDRVRFFGFDGPFEMTGPDSPRRALTALHGYLAAHVEIELLPYTVGTIDHLVGSDDRWSDPAVTMDPSLSVGLSADAGELRLIADDLLALLTAESPRLIRATSREDWWRANLHGRTATGLLRYHAVMADTSEARMVRLMGLRDAMMADNLLAIAERERQARRGPTLVHAHNRHLQRDESLWLLPPGWGPLEGRTLKWWSAGAVVAARLGDEYAFVASALGAATHQGLDAPEPDTLEGILSTLPGNRYVVDSASLAGALGATGTEPAPRTGTSANHSYFPLDPGQLRETDGLLFVKHVAPGPDS
ncbi:MULTISPECIES: erythromycin esterase family protein [unclassified Streptosporangium]|uniref:erythromycin esterase family protein n=1 Tax=unclassified Streptosporangium TaxID=2632669 RepID=UPI002E2D608D|nr:MULTISPECIES: erythromycin esterase family protein [unclassified Streptosporangium]